MSLTIQLGLPLIQNLRPNGKSCIVYDMLLASPVLIVIFVWNILEPLEHFSIIPKERTILAGKKATFTLFFRPVSSTEMLWTNVKNNKQTMKIYE